MPARAETRGRIRQRQEAAILAAVEKVFARAGFQAATMAGIALQAGLQKSNLHYYIGTKADFQTQVCAVLRRPAPEQGDCRRATEHVLNRVLRGCGLDEAGLAGNPSCST